MDLHNNISAKRLISPIAAGTTGTGKTSAAALGDRQGYAGVEIIFDFGTLTATNATVTVTLLEGDVTGTMTSVADADLIGTETLAGLAAAATRIRCAKSAAEDHERSGIVKETMNEESISTDTSSRAQAR